MTSPDFVPLAQLVRDVRGVAPAAARANGVIAVNDDGPLAGAPDARERTGVRERPADRPDDAPSGAPTSVAAASSDAASREDAAYEIRRAVRDARLFRARLADALDAAVALLMRRFASDVLARELRTAPCDVATIVRRLASEAPVVRVRVAPEDAALGTSLPVAVDEALQPGDAIVELAGGELDARLGVRLAAILDDPA
ncbi:MAG TPA: hypothetical protein VFB22_06140 [Candidatus Baltobacteraceae bacterium]|nr:hypothetical protein [Candidatus Baltobacteraceae bacterium]